MKDSKQEKVQNEVFAQRFGYEALQDMVYKPINPRKS
jgi:hypothetical protein